MDVQATVEPQDPMCVRVHRLALGAVDLTNPAVASEHLAIDTVTALERVVSD